MDSRHTRTKTVDKYATRQRVIIHSDTAERAPGIPMKERRSRTTADLLTTAFNQPAERNPRVTAERRRDPFPT